MHIEFDVKLTFAVGSAAVSECQIILVTDKVWRYCNGGSVYDAGRKVLMLLDPFESQLKKDGVGSDEFMDISLSPDCTSVDGNAAASSRNHYL